MHLTCSIARGLAVASLLVTHAVVPTSAFCVSVHHSGHSSCTHGHRRLRGGGLRIAMEQTSWEAAAGGAMEVARRAVEEASAVSRFVANSYSEKFEEGTIGKIDASPVTVADFAVQAVVCKRLMDAFPDDPVIAEEAADELRANVDLRERVLQAVRVVEPRATGEDICKWIDRGAERHYRARFWTLDPIDGTKGFLRRKQYAICLALVADGVPCASALACPNLPLDFEDEDSPTGTLFFACLGGGAWQSAMPADLPASGLGSATRKPVKLEERLKSTNDLRFCESFEAAHSNHGLSASIAYELAISRPPIRLDSQVKYGVMARGDADIYLRLPHNHGGDMKVGGSTYQENIWDHAAGHLILSEAGGSVTDMNGSPLDFRHGAKLVKNTGVVASGGQALHGRVLAAISASLSRGAPCMQHNSTDPV